MQKMSNSGQMTPQMMREYAMEQAMLQQGMEELSGHFDERSAMRQRLMQLKDEMQDLEAEYLKRNISEKIQQRQKQLQQRMLDTVKSMRQEGEDKEERKAETARPFVPRITDRTIDLPLQKKIRGVLEKMKMENYPREYDELIRRYFERIGR
jgi:hypothetical protein